MRRTITVISLRKFVLNVELILLGIRLTGLILGEYYDDMTMLKEIPEPGERDIVEPTERVKV